MHSKHFLFGIILLSILMFSIMTAVNATTYTIGVKAGDSYTWEIKTLDPSYPGVPSGVKVGDRETMAITAVDETSTGWVITYHFTSYTGSSSSETETVPKNPTSWGFGLICALPVNEYLTGAVGSSHVSGNKITISYGLYSLEIVYDTSTGVMSSMKNTEAERGVVFEIALVPSIPGYELPIILGVSTVSTLCLIYLVMKKK